MGRRSNGNPFLPPRLTLQMSLALGGKRLKSEGGKG